MLNANVRFVLAAVLASSCVSVSFASQTEPADGDSPPTKPQAQIIVFNLARVPKRDLFRAEAEVTRIFAEADMDVRWADGALDHSASLFMDFSANNSSPTGCKVAGHARELRLRLVPRIPRGVATGTLGFSLPCAEFGIDSTIFVDQCEAVAYRTSASFSRVVGYAIGHELGHILLRSGEHSRSGLMRARWDRNDWVRATTGGIRLDPEQGRRMRLELFRMESLAPIAPWPTIEKQTSISRSTKIAHLVQ